MIYVAVKNTKGEALVLPYKNYEYFCQLAGDFLGMEPDGRNFKTIEAAGKSKFEFYAVFETPHAAKVCLIEEGLPSNLAPKLAHAIETTQRRIVAAQLKP